MPFSVPVTFKLQSEKELDLVPESLKSNYPNESIAIDKLNTLLKERGRLLKTSKPSNSLIQNLDNEINALRTVIGNSIAESKN